MEVYYIALLGASNVGKVNKCSFSPQLTFRHLSASGGLTAFLQEIYPTLNGIYSFAWHCKGTKCSIQVFDFCEDPEWSLTDGWFAVAKGIYILAYSSVSRLSFEVVERYYQRLLRQTRPEGEEKESPPLAICLVATQCDLEAQAEVSTEEGQALANSWGTHFVDCSAKDQVNLDQILNAFVEVILLLV